MPRSEELKGFTDIFNRRVTGSHSWAKRFKLNFVMRKTFLRLSKQVLKVTVLATQEFWRTLKKAVSALTCDLHSHSISHFSCDLHMISCCDNYYLSKEMENIFLLWLSLYIELWPNPPPFQLARNWRISELKKHYVVRMQVTCDCWQRHSFLLNIYWPLSIGAFQDHCKQTIVNRYSNKYNEVENPNWQAADQLVIFKHTV